MITKKFLNIGVWLTAFLVFTSLFTGPAFAQDQSIELKLVSESSFASQDLEDISYGNGRYVAVGKNGLIMTSDDGNNWSKISQKIDSSFYSVASNGEKFVAVGSEASIYISNDGKAWTKVSFPVYNFYYSIAWNGSKFVAVGQKGAIISSEDGIHWSSLSVVDNGNTPFNQYLNSIVSNGKLFVAVGSNGTIIVSTDGITWSSKTSNTTENISSITWNGSIFMAVGTNNIVLSSKDADTWQCNKPDFQSNLGSVISNGNNFIIFGNFSDEVYFSNDGVTWSAHYSPNNPAITQLAYLNGKYFAVGMYGSIMSSSDGLTWKILCEQFISNINSLAFNGNTYIATGEMNGIISSTDGINWSFKDNTLKSYVVRNVIWANGQFVAVGLNFEICGDYLYSDIIATSPDGFTWTIRYSIPGEALNDVAWNGSQFIAVGTTGTILSSNDGISWLRTTPHSNEYLNKVIWGDNKFVVVGANGTILISTDGSYWTNSKINTSNYLALIIWNGKNFMYYNDNADIYSSTDCFGWKLEVSGENRSYGPFNYVVWDGYQYVALGIGNIVVSSDGITWGNPNFTRSTLTTVFWDGKKYIAGGDHGTIFVFERKSTDASVTSSKYQVNGETKTISGMAYGTSVSELKSNLTPANGAVYYIFNGQVNIISGSVQSGMTVKVTAEDGNTTKVYTIITDKNTDATLTSSQFAVDNNSNIISNMPYGISLSDFRNSLQAAYGAQFKIYNNNLEVTDGNISTGMTVLVTAEDTTYIKTYALTTNKNTDTALNSDTYTVNLNNKVISGIAFGTKLDQLIKNLQPAFGAKIKVLSKNKEVTSGIVVTGMKLVVTAEDSVSSVTFSIITNKNTDISISSAKYKIIKSKSTIGNIPKNTLISIFLKNVKVAKGAVTKVYSSNGKTVVKSGYIKDGMKLKVIAEDGKTTKTFKIMLH